MVATNKHPLIKSLLSDPEAFKKSGKDYQLLQEYFDGLPVKTLRPLLLSENLLVQRIAAFVASELGSQAHSLIEVAIALLQSNDRYLQYHALEIVTACSEKEKSGSFAHAVAFLNSEDEILRLRTMRLLTSVYDSQIEAAQHFFSNANPHHEQHTNGLRMLAAARQERLEPGVIVAALSDSDPITRRYGAIAAKRMLRTHPELRVAVESSTDTDIQKFFEGD